ncbi:MAG: AMP-binding protein [Chitinophagales bacterium]
MANSYPNFNTLIEYFYHWENTTPDKIFLRQPKGDTWKTLTFAGAGQEARKMATALAAMGLQKGDHIAIFSKNCYHWILADLAIMMGGFVSVPLYASLPKKQLQEVLKKSDSKALFVGKLDVWGNRADAISKDVQVIRFPHYEGNAKVEIGTDWAALLNQHEAQTENFIPDPNSLWTILFTSGTTGSPKGVMHLHRTPAEISTNEMKTNWLGVYKYQNHRFLSFLPLNHVGERIGIETTALCSGGMISFAESLDTFAKNLQDTQPTLFFAVPRIWTKFYLGVAAKIPPQKLNFLLKIPIVSTFIKRKLLKSLGMSNAKIVATGAAITPAYIKDWYKKLGIHLIEAYGMTEVCGSMTNSPMRDYPADSVGKSIPRGEVKIHPETGEILMKSPYMMVGYYKEPEMTATVLIDGWMHSGDKGKMDENGFLKVIGRVKDAFKTSKGSYVTPNPLEEVLGKNDYIEQVCVVGLGIPQPIAVVNLSEIGLAADKSVVATSLQQTLQELNQTVANYERVSTMVIDPNPWNETNGLLTPTLKVRRGAIDDAYGRNYLEWHEGKEKVVWM